MSNTIAKRYVGALLDGAKKNDIKEYSIGLNAIESLFNDKKFTNIIKSPLIENNIKNDLLLSGISKLNNKRLNNFISVLSENNRLESIPSIAQEVRLEIAKSLNSYNGSIISNQKMTKADIEQIQKNLSKKLNSTIKLTLTKSDYNGIKVEVKDLGIEVAFSKSLMNQQLIEHILKAI